MFTRRLRTPRRVSFSQWAIISVSLILASALFFSSLTNDFVLFAIFLTILNIALLINVLREALSTKLFGKTLLVGSTFIYFWLEALGETFQALPFRLPLHSAASDAQFDPLIIQEAFLYVALFQFMLFVGYSFQPPMRPLVSWVSSRLDLRTSFSSLIKYALIAAAIIPLLLGYSFNIGDATGALLSARGTQSPQDIGLVHYLSFFGMFGAALFLAEGLSFQRKNRIPYLALGIVAALPFVMYWGARHIWLLIALPSIVISLWRLQDKLVPTKVIQFGFLALCVLLVVQLQFLLRGGWNQINDLEPSQLLRRDTTGQFTALLFAEHLVPESHDYFLEPALPYFVIHWIPRKVWPDKPIMRSWVYYNEAYTEGSQAFNVTPSIIGQFHINWGVFGVVFIGAWLGFLVYVADQLFSAVNINRQRAMAVLLGMFYAFIISSFRFYSPIYFTYLVFGLLAMLMLTQGKTTRSLDKNASISSGMIADKPARLS